MQPCHPIWVSAFVDNYTKFVSGVCCVCACVCELCACACVFDGPFFSSQRLSHISAAVTPVRHSKEVAGGRRTGESDGALVEMPSECGLELRGRHLRDS